MSLDLAPINAMLEAATQEAAANAVTGRFLAQDEYTAQSRFNRLAREALPAIRALLAEREGKA